MNEYVPNYLKNFVLWLVTGWLLIIFLMALFGRPMYLFSDGKIYVQWEGNYYKVNSNTPCVMKEIEREVK